MNSLSYHKLLHIGNEAGMSALLGNIVEFSKEHKNWSQYAERLLHFLMANQIQQAERKCTVLLSMIGPKASKQLASLTIRSKPGEKSFQELLELMKEHNHPTPSTIVLHFKFHTRDSTTPRRVNSNLHSSVTGFSSDVWNHLTSNTGRIATRSTGVWSAG